MSLPRVSVLFGNGNLLPEIAAVDGIGGIIISGTATVAMALNEPKQLFGLKDLKALGITGEPVGTVAAVSGNTTVGTIGTDGDVFEVLVAGEVIAEFVKTATETSVSLLATAIRAAVNAGTATHGYTAAGTTGTIFLTGMVAQGAAINGLEVALTYPGSSSTATFSGGITVVTNDHAWRQVSEFYKATGGNQELWIMLVADTVTMASMLDKEIDTNAIRLLTAANGRIRLLAVARKPNVGYNAGTEFIDEDVAAAMANASALVAYENENLSFLRVLIEGRVVNNDSANIYEPQTAENGFGGVVLGSSLADGSASVGLALGWACSYAAHIKIGKVANGSLPITTAYIGNKPLPLVANLAYLHGLGYISFTTHPGKAGIYFGIDRMGSTDDYRFLAHGRIVDKAATIAAAVYVDVLESEIEVAQDGKIASQEVAYLRAIIGQQIEALMGGQISGYQVLVAEDQHIINTGRLEVQLRVQPLGYASFIEVTIGLTATV